MIREPKSGPLLVTAEVAAKIGRLLRRSFRGYNGVEVRDTLDGVSIGLAPASRGGRGGATSQRRTVKVLGYHSGPLNVDMSALLVSNIDDQDQPVGDPYPAYVWSYSELPGQIAVTPMNLLWPPAEINDFVEIEEATKRVPAAGQVAAWWVCWPFARGGCEVGGPSA